VVFAPNETKFAVTSTCLGREQVVQKPKRKTGWWIGNDGIFEVSVTKTDTKRRGTMGDREL
jgi:hypothetical protein